jgi:hypothetical protein
VSGLDLMLLLGVVALVRRFVVAVVDRLANRLASWLFPSNQACTFRVGLGLVRAAAAIAPREIARGVDWAAIGRAELPRLAWYGETWPFAAAAVVHLRENLSLDRRYPSPLRTGAWLLCCALSLRLVRLVSQVELVVGIAGISAFGVICFAAVLGGVLLLFTFGPMVAALMHLLRRVLAVARPQPQL